MQVLAQLPRLQNLTLKGCPLAEQPGYPENVRELLPQLQILDSHRLSLPVKAGKQPGKAALGAAGVLQPSKSSKLPPANSDAAVDMGKSAVVREGIHPKATQSIEQLDKSDTQLLGSRLSKQAPKRKHDESASAAPESAAVRQPQASKEPSKKQQKTGSAAGPAPEAMPSAQAAARAKPAALTGKAKAKREQVAEASLPASMASVEVPETQPGSVELKQKMIPVSGSTAQQGSGREPSGRVLADKKAQPVAASKSGKQPNSTSTAPKQKNAKRAAEQLKHSANGSHAHATGKQVINSLK